MTNYQHLYEAWDTSIPEMKNVTTWVTFIFRLTVFSVANWAGQSGRFLAGFLCWYSDLEWSGVLGEHADLVEALKNDETSVCEDLCIGTCLSGAR